MNDHEGKGGSYVIDDSGDKKLVERTRDVGEQEPAPAPAAEQSRVKGKNKPQEG